MVVNGEPAIKEEDIINNVEDEPNFSDTDDYQDDICDEGN